MLKALYLFLSSYLRDKPSSSCDSADSTSLTWPWKWDCSKNKGNKLKHFHSKGFIASNCNEIKLMVCKDQVLDFLCLDHIDTSGQEHSIFNNSIVMCCYTPTASIHCLHLQTHIGSLNLKSRFLQTLIKQL